MAGKKRKRPAPSIAGATPSASSSSASGDTADITLAPSLSVPGASSSAASASACISESSHEDRVLSVISAVYQSVDAYSIAREAKRQQRSSGVYLDGLQYGEVNPKSIARALAWISPVRAGEVFYDLGSGSGVAVLTAAALHPQLSTAKGIEIVEQLHDAAVAAHGEMLSFSRGNNTTITCSTSTGRSFAKAEFVLGDALAYPWYEDGGIVFCYTTCFTDEMMGRLQKGAERLQSGSRVLISGRPIDSDQLELLHKETLACGKKAGKSMFFAYMKT